MVAESWPYKVISAWKCLTLQVDQIGISLVRLLLYSDGKYFSSQVKLVEDIQSQKDLRPSMYL